MVLIRQRPVAGIIPIIDLAIIEEIDRGSSADNIVELKKYRSNISTTAIVDLTKRYESVGSDEARKQLSWLFKEAQHNFKRTIVSLNGKVAAVIVPISDLEDLDRLERQLTESQKEMLASIKGALPNQLLPTPGDAGGDDNGKPRRKRRGLPAVRVSRHHPRAPSAG
jgi:prevent-host-death family protein